MKIQFPSQFNKLKELLHSFDQRELCCNQINFTLHDEEAHVPITHFFEDADRLKSEFICWGEKVADNLILTWLVEGKSIDNAPIAMIDSEQSPVSVVAKNPEDFLSMLPYGTSAIGSVAENCLASWAEAEFTDEYFAELLTTSTKKASNENDFAVNEYLNIAKMYGDTHLLERPIEEIREEILGEGQAFMELLQWYKDNGIEISKNPFKLIKEAVTLYPNFFDRAIELGLPFQK
jgi:hypothetical protein